jgi:membrane fusion protein
MPLFRTEAAPENNGRYYGVITLRTRWVYWFLSIAVTVFSTAAIVLFAYGTYTKRANLQGYLVPTQGITRIHSSMAGRIGEVRVTEGQLVAAGDTLAVVLDERQSAAGSEARGAVEAQIKLRLQNLRSTQEQQTALYKQTREGLRSRLSALQTEAAQLKQEHATQAKRLDMARKTESRYDELVSKQFVSPTTAQEKAEAVIDQQARLQTLARGQTTAEREIAAVLSELASLPMRENTQLAELERGIQAAQQELIEVQTRREVLVVAPHAGTVSGLTGKAGLAVSVDKPLMTLIPAGSALEGHLFAPSKDAGFVRKGQTVLIRYQAYPYQKFGHYSAVVQEVSSTPLMPGELMYPVAPRVETSALLASIPTMPNTEPMFRVKVKLASQTAQAYGQPQALQAGMQLEADVMLDTRTLFEWVLEPLYSLRGKYFE